MQIIFLLYIFNANNLACGSSVPFSPHRISSHYHKVPLFLGTPHNSQLVHVLQHCAIRPQCKLVCFRARMEGSVLEGVENDFCYTRLYGKGEARLHPQPLETSRTVCLFQRLE